MFSVEYFGLACFALAILHTFSVVRLRVVANRFARSSWAYGVLHVLAEVELVFALWALVFLTGLLISQGPSTVASYLEAQSFIEPVFVFVVLSASATRPILHLASLGLNAVARAIPISRPQALYGVTLVLGSLLGSLITEPAAMTVTAIILLESFFKGTMSRPLRYATLGLLFVNISIGGTLTHFAAPPVLMVAGKWQWDTPFMFTHFGWKGALSSLISTAFVMIVFRRELANLKVTSSKTMHGQVPIWVTVGQTVLLVATVYAAHSQWVLFGLFCVLWVWTRWTAAHQNLLQWKQGVLVGLFLAGLVILGPAQRWWLQLVLMQLDSASLYLGAIGLTAVTDNAALTYLGSQVDLPEVGRYALVAGGVVGGGLTVIANAPNPAGYAILSPAFGERGISPLGLLAAAAGPTLVAAAVFWFL